MSLYESIIPEIASLKKEAEEELRRERNLQDQRRARIILDKIREAMKNGTNYHVVSASDLPYTRDAFSEMLQARGYQIEEGRSAGYLMHWKITWD